MAWAIGLTVVLIALLIPVVVVGLDAIRSRRPHGVPTQPSDDGEALLHRLAALEDEVDELRRETASLRDDLNDLQRVLEDQDPGEARGPSPGFGA